MTGRCRKPFRNMIWAASSTVVSGVADCGSLVIQAETGAVVRSAPDAAALSTSRSVRMPARNEPCMTRAEPTRSRTMAAAACASGQSGEVVAAGAFIRSRRVPVLLALQPLSPISSSSGSRCGEDGSAISSESSRHSDPAQLDNCGHRIQNSCKVVWSNSACACSGVTACV